MLSFLEKIDHKIFYFMNDLTGNPFFDVFFPVFTDLHKMWWFVWIILPLALGRWFYLKKWEAGKVLIGAVMVVSCADAVNTRLLKPTIQRERPPSSGVELVLRTDRFGGYSMPSNHATNISGAMTFLALAYPAWKLLFFLIWLSVAYSRVYVGVHFPGDVLVGALLGASYALLFFKPYYKICFIIKEKFASLRKK